MAATKVGKATRGPARKASDRIQDIQIQDVEAPQNPVPVDGGFFMPPVFRVEAVLPHERSGRVVVGVIVLVTDGKARTSSVRVDNDAGVGSVTMRTIPIREIVTEGVWEVIRRPVVREEDVLELVRVSRDDADAVTAVRKVVGYMEAER